MKIVCPKCELKGQIDVAPTGAKRRIACVRCATTFDIPLTNTPARVPLPELHPLISSGETLAKTCDNNILPTVAQTASALEMREEYFSEISSLDVSLSDLEEDFSLSSADLMMGQPEAVSSNEIAAAASTTVENKLTTFMMPEQPDTEIEFLGAASVDAQTPVDPPATLKSKNSRPPSDAYAFGVRLMQVSPLWLLVAGFSFISFIVLCNWLVKPVEQTGEAASVSALANNQASNRAVNRLVNSTTAQPLAVDPATQPVAEPDASLIKVEAKEAAAATPTPAAPAVAPITPPASPLKSPAEPEAGKVTIQIGSYNAPAQAQERVASVQAAGFKAWVVTVDIPKRGTWYRVQSGRFATRDEAERYGRKLRDQGIVSSFITTDVQQ